MLVMMEAVTTTDPAATARVMVEVGTLSLAARFWRSASCSAARNDDGSPESVSWKETTGL